VIAKTKDPVTPSCDDFPATTRTIQAATTDHEARARRISAFADLLDPGLGRCVPSTRRSLAQAELGRDFGGFPVAHRFLACSTARGSARTHMGDHECDFDSGGEISHAPRTGRHGTAYITQ